MKFFVDTALGEPIEVELDLADFKNVSEARTEAATRGVEECIERINDIGCVVMCYEEKDIDDVSNHYCFATYNLLKNSSHQKYLPLLREAMIQEFDLDPEDRSQLPPNEFGGL